MKHDEKVIKSGVISSYNTLSIKLLLTKFYIKLSIFQIKCIAQKKVNLKHSLKNLTWLCLKQS